MNLPKVLDYIKGLFDSPFSSTGKTLGIVLLSVTGLLALWVLCGFVGAIRDIFGDLMKKLTRRTARILTLALWLTLIIIIAAIVYFVGVSIN